MHNKLKCLLWLNRSKKNKQGLCPIYIRITHQTKKVEYSTGVFVKAGDWNVKAHCIRANAHKAEENNKGLKTKLLEIADIQSELVRDNNTISIAAIKSKLRGKVPNHTSLLHAINYHNSLMEKGVGKTYALGTYKAYIWFTDKVKAFLKYQYNRNDILLVELNHRFLSEFEQYLFNVLNNQVNTVQKNITQLRKIINLCIDLDWLNKMPFKRLKAKAYTPKRDHLTIGELTALENLQITNLRLQMIRDKFVFQCYTGIAFIDLNTLSIKNVVKGVDGEDWIVLNRQKTKSRSTIPLLPSAKDILNKYNSTERTTLFPICSNQKFNKYLKELSTLCGINKRITTHTGRRTFATTITLSNGVPIETVSRMLGHSDLKTTAIYATVVDTKVSEDMKKAKAKLQTRITNP